MPIKGHTKSPYVRFQFFISEVLEGRYPNSQTLVDKFEISSRTAYRDIEFLKDRMELELAYDARRRGFKLTDPANAPFPLLALSEAELFGLLVAGKVIANYEGTSLHQPLAAVFQRMTRQLGHDRDIAVSRMDLNLSVHPFGQESIPGEIFEILARAFAGKRTLRFHYRNAGQQQFHPRHVHPYHVACIQSRWYLVAFDPERNGLRTFVLNADRLQRIQLTTKSFVRDPAFDPRTYFQHSFATHVGTGDYHVEIHFNPWAADLIGRRTWTPTQIITPKADGGIIMTMRLSSLEDIERWLLGYGDSATVISPPELRERLRSAALTIAKQYAPAAATKTPAAHKARSGPTPKSSRQRPPSTAKARAAAHSSPSRRQSQKTRTRPPTAAA
jgi:proteasome accessory factor B